MSLEYNKISKGLKPGERIHVLSKEVLFKYDIYRPVDKPNVFYLKLYLKDGNTIYGYVEDKNIREVIKILQFTAIYTLYVKEYAINSNLRGIEFIDACGIGLIDYIL